MLKSVFPSRLEIWVYLKVLGFDLVNVPLFKIMQVAFRAQQQNILAGDKIRQFKMPASLEFSNMPEMHRFGILQQSTTEKIL